MAVLGQREIIPRSFEHKLGDSPTATRVFAVTVDEPTAASEVLAAIGITHGQSHPDHTTLTCDGISVEETDRQHAQVTYTYGIPDPEDKEDPQSDAPPWLQADTWSFSSSNASVACTEYFPEPPVAAGQNNVPQVLANRAGDAIFGISKSESELKITISGSRLTLNLAQLKRYVNCINNKPWAGFPRHTVQFVGFSASPSRLEWQGLVLDYWQISLELVYRSSTHNLSLPHVGWNVIVDGKKQRAWAYIEEDGVREKVPAPHPVALNMSGGFLCDPGQDAARNPDGDTSYPDDGTTYFGG